METELGGALAIHACVCVYGSDFSQCKHQQTRPAICNASVQTAINLCYWATFISIEGMLPADGAFWTAHQTPVTERKRHPAGLTYDRIVFPRNAPQTPTVAPQSVGTEAGAGAFT